MNAFIGNHYYKLKPCSQDLSRAGRRETLGTRLYKDKKQVTIRLYKVKSFFNPSHDIDTYYCYTTGIVQLIKCVKKLLLDKDTLKKDFLQCNIQRIVLKILLH